ncbi:hypothetical protein T03_15345 [Trichinella britovi]|uniref:Uncharacterized protein n=1 Tax=Trichinella britovi TaxID=45882 RepID=A0A0V0YT09_TRIBR|nr:hypothetical protein T03_15345 [Trichinella britovi]
MPMESSSQNFFNGFTGPNTTHPRVVSIATGSSWLPRRIFSPRN